jgi:Ca2+-transporting ATPase
MNTHSWHTLTIQEVSAYLSVNRSSGLSEKEAQKRLMQFGLNRFREEKREPIWKVFLEEIREPMILLLLTTGALYALWGEWNDTLTIFFIILTVVAVEVFNERRAERAITGLRKLAEPTILVRRDGQHYEVSVEKIVPGDVILLQPGCRIPADGRLIESYGIAVDESALTGESILAEKEIGVDLKSASTESIPLAERRNMIFAGTQIRRGRGIAIAVATGASTELGRIANLADEIKAPRTPLQQALRELTYWLVWLALAFSVMIPLLGWLRGGQSFKQMALTGLTLAFATIPEELPILTTIVLALGAYRLAQRQVIIKRLRAAETLSAITVIAMDKTGTLTENRMEVRQLYPNGLKYKLLEIGILCNSMMVLGPESGVRSQEQETTDSLRQGSGQASIRFRINHMLFDKTQNRQRTPAKDDPLDIALLQAAQKADLDLEALLKAYPLVQEFTFDDALKIMATVHKRSNGFRIAVKGAPEAVLKRCTRHWIEGNEQTFLEANQREILEIVACLAGEGLRVVALAEKIISDPQPISSGEIESGLTFVGLIGFVDPPRPQANQAITACRVAGIRPVMITGDHLLTAQNVANQVGLSEQSEALNGPELNALSNQALREVVGRVNIYTRTTPEHKLRIVRALQEQGEVVAVTGDGINDALALAAADIGIAMGRTGSDTARDAADMILTDDNFATIVHAIEEGRLLFANLQKAIRYYLACKVALILITLLLTLLGIPIPFSPVQIILMELFMDLGASVAFVSERPESSLMHRRPRNLKEPFMNRAMVKGIFSLAIRLFSAVSVVYLITWFGGAELIRVQTMAFFTWLLGHVLLAINLRSEQKPLFRSGLFSNPMMVTWSLATLAFIMIMSLVPEIQIAVKIVTLSLREWVLIVSAAVAGTLITL